MLVRLVQRALQRKLKARPVVVTDDHDRDQRWAVHRRVPSHAGKSRRRAKVSYHKAADVTIRARPSIERQITERKLARLGRGGVGLAQLDRFAAFVGIV